MKGDYQKPLKKLSLFFLSNPPPFNGQSHQKQKGPGPSDQSLFWFGSQFTKTSLLVIYCMTKFDGVIQSSFWVIPNIAPANLCKPIHDIINYFISICSFESAKYRKEVVKLQEFEYLKNEKSFLGEIKNTFHSSWRAIILWKNKSLIKNSGHKF